MADPRRNVGGWDKDARLVVGGAAGALALFAAWPMSARAGAAALCAIALGTAIGGYCPLNQLLGVNSSGPMRLT
ncbi:YgaP-like transmembrane domain [Ramlibacter sp. AN1015]|uniref:YgaP-like transmembrane domain n=1 Tax=Ramlibacter sp. AN1015 TaxID=3133428 RepID=UPI0030C5574C